MESKTMSDNTTTLDGNWEEQKTLAHQMVDDIFQYLENIKDTKVWRPIPEESKNLMKSPFPIDATNPNIIYGNFLKHILPYNNGNVHPRFWSWVHGTGTTLAMLADMLASGMNANVCIGEHMPMYVDRQVLNWSKEMMGFPPSASGLLVSGASLANITALIVARNSLHPEIRTNGLVPHRQLTVYASSETHNCLDKAVEVIGIGSRFFRRVPVNADYTINVGALDKMIREDRSQGCLPLCIIGNAGTVNTGAIDDLDALAAIAKREKIWFHIDGAFGAIPKILPEFRTKLQAIELADSVSFDFHKWMYVNYEVACVLIKDAELHRSAFTVPVDYLMNHERGLAAGPDSFSNYGLELSRGFKALKVWMSLQEHGLKKFQQLIRQNLSQAGYLASLVNAAPLLELMAPTTLNIVCFRYSPGHLEKGKLNKLNKEILMELQCRGIAAPSYTILQGNYVLRVAIANHRSTFHDFEILVEETIRLGKELSKKSEFT